jgi:GntR family transcriptional regulator
VKVPQESDQSNTLYGQVASQLREQIYSGKLAPGEQLAGETALADQLGVSRSTVRGALSILQREGHISKQQGARSTVNPVRVRQALAHLETLDETLVAQGLTSDTKVIQYNFRRPSRAIADRLAIPQDAEILAVRRVHSVGARPIAVVDLAISAELAADLTRRDVEERAFYDLLPDRLCIRVGRATQTVRAEAASPDVAEALWVPESSPLLVCERLTLSDQSEPLVHATFRYHGDRFEFQSELSTHRRTIAWALPGLAANQGLDILPDRGVSA